MLARWARELEGSHQRCGKQFSRPRVSWATESPSNGQGSALPDHSSERCVRTLCMFMSVTDLTDTGMPASGQVAGIHLSLRLSNP